jgi:hypothetical protein
MRDAHVVMYGGFESRACKGSAPHELIMIRVHLVEAE